jgi:uncharacterized membrane protein
MLDAMDSDMPITSPGQDGAVEEPRQPGMRTRDAPEAQQLWILFQADQQRISALDTIAMTIRGWTVTLVSALVGFSLSQHHRSLLPVAMIGSVLLGLLDVRYRRTQLLHANRVDKVEQVIAPGYRLRPYRDPGGPSWLILIRSRYGSSISFYAVVFFLLLLLWIVT